MNLCVAILMQVNSLQMPGFALLSYINEYPLVSSMASYKIQNIELTGWISHGYPKVCKVVFLFHGSARIHHNPITNRSYDWSMHPRFRGFSGFFPWWNPKVRWHFKPWNPQISHTKNVPKPGDGRPASWSGCSRPGHMAVMEYEWDIATTVTTLWVDIRL